MAELLPWAGVVGPPLFVAVFLGLGAVKPGYDARARFVSEGSIGELGWIQIVNFLALGIMLLAFAVALWADTGNYASGRIGSGLMAAVGVSLIASGVFVTDPSGTKVMSRHGLVHVIAGMLVFGGLTLACFAFAWRFHAHGGFAAYTVATGIFIPIGMVVTNAAGRRTGVAQRVLIIVAWTWITVLAWRLATP